MQNPQAVAAMAKQGIVPRAALGLSNAQLRQVAADIGIDRLIAQQLWASGIHDARVLASLVDDPERDTPKQMERWVRDFDNWALCDACCFNLFDKTPFAYAKAVAWSARKEEYVKRAAFSLVAALAVNDAKAEDSEFLRFVPILKREAGDDRPIGSRGVSRAIREGQKIYVWDVPRVRDDEARFENMVALELCRAVSGWNEMGYGRFSLNFIRTKDQQEVDFVLSDDGQPLLLVDACAQAQQPSAALMKFQAALQVPAVLLVQTAEGYRRLSNDGQDILIAPACQYLAGLP